MGVFLPKRPRTLPDASKGGRQLHVPCSPASASAASAGPARRALRQLRLPRRPSCPPQRRNSMRFRAIRSRPDPVKWRTRGATPFDRAGAGPQAASPTNWPARAPGRGGLAAAGRPAPADGPRRPPPSTTEASRLPASVVASLSPCRRWTPRPSAASWRPPASPPFAALRASESRQASTEEISVSTVNPGVKTAFPMSPPHR